jgi:hypothetical protein
MKKNDIAHLVLGMALLGSSVMGYGMDEEVIGKKKGGSTQATDKLEKGECFVPKGFFQECLKHFLECKKYTLSSLLGNVFAPKELKGQQPTDHYQKHFQKNSSEIKEGLDKDYKQAKEFFQKDGNRHSLREKVQIYLEQNDSENLKNLDVNNINNIEAFCKKNSQELSGFLNFLSKEKGSKQELQKHLKNLQGTKNGVFTEKDRGQCAQQLSEAVLGFLNNANNTRDIRCKFYDRIGNDNIKRPYCTAYVDLQAPIGAVHFYHPDGLVEAKPTNTLVMVFRKDSKDEKEVYLKHAYPHLGRGVFLKEDQKNDLERSRKKVIRCVKVFLESKNSNRFSIRQ